MPHHFPASISTIDPKYTYVPRLVLLSPHQLRRVIADPRVFLSLTGPADGGQVDTWLGWGIQLDCEEIFSKEFKNELIVNNNNNNNSALEL